MEKITIVQINKEKSNENFNNDTSLLVVELSAIPSVQWNSAFTKNVKSIRSKESQLLNAQTDKKDIYITYKQSQKRDNAFALVSDLVNRTNQVQSEFDLWIDKTNLMLKNQNQNVN